MWFFEKYLVPKHLNGDFLKIHQGKKIKLIFFKNLIYLVQDVGPKEMS